MLKGELRIAKGKNGVIASIRFGGDAAISSLIRIYDPNH